MFKVLFAGGALAALLAGCGGTDESLPNDEVLPGDPRFVRDAALDIDNVSKKGEKRSHNMGKNCMGCHQPHGPGKGLFSVAGTVYGPDNTPLLDGVLELRTLASGGGDLVMSVQVDSLGNFFTTEKAPFPDTELFVLVKSADGSLTSEMPFPTLSGACNVCHNEQKRVVLAPKQ